MRLLINGFPPTSHALAAYVSLLKEEAGPTPWMIATVNADLRPLFAETIVRDHGAEPALAADMWQALGSIAGGI